MKRPDEAIQRVLAFKSDGYSHSILLYLDYVEAELKLEKGRLDKLERLMRRGHDLSAYGFDEENDTWGKSGFAFSTEIDEDGFDVTVGRKYYPNIREAIDKLEEQEPQHPGYGVDDDEWMNAPMGKFEEQDQ